MNPKPHANMVYHQHTNHQNPDEIWVTSKQLAERYKISLRCLQNWVRDGVIPVVRVGRVLRFNIASCDSALSTRIGK